MPVQLVVSACSGPWWITHPIILYTEQARLSNRGQKKKTLQSISEIHNFTKAHEFSAVQRCIARVSVGGHVLIQIGQQGKRQTVVNSVQPTDHFYDVTKSYTNDLVVNSSRSVKNIRSL